MNQMDFVRSFMSDENQLYQHHTLSYFSSSCLFIMPSELIYFINLKKVLILKSFSPMIY